LDFPIEELSEHLPVKTNPLIVHIQGTCVVNSTYTQFAHISAALQGVQVSPQRATLACRGSQLVGFTSSHLPRITKSKATALLGEFLIKVDASVSFQLPSACSIATECVLAPFTFNTILSGHLRVRRLDPGGALNRKYADLLRQYICLIPGLNYYEPELIFRTDLLHRFELTGLNDRSIRVDGYFEITLPDTTAPTSNSIQTTTTKNSTPRKISTIIGIPELDQGDHKLYFKDGYRHVQLYMLVIANFFSRHSPKTHYIPHVMNLRISTTNANSCLQWQYQVRELFSFIYNVSIGKIMLPPVW